MQAVADTLFALLRAALHPEREERVAWSVSPDWPSVYRLATEQGVLAIAWDGYTRLLQEGQIPTEWQMPRMLKLQWAMNVDKIERRYAQQKNAAADLACHYAQASIRTVVLKGFAVSAVYPIPSHRECGDLDCYLCGSYEQGNVIAEKQGGRVERDYYKHSHIHYKGLMVENHQFCVAIRGSQERKALERYLQSLVATPSGHYVEETHLEIPSADFNALFLTAHGFSHFLNEGLKLRHLCDWMMVLKHGEEQIDWRAFYSLTDRLSYTAFASVMTALAIRDLGLELHNSAVRSDVQYADRVLNDILWQNNAIYSSGKSRFKQRMMLITNRLQMIWKYRLIYKRSMVVDLCKMVAAYFFEKNPKI